MATRQLSTLVLQNLFFPGLKVKTPEKWKSALAVSGETTQLEMERSGGLLRATLIKPKGAAIPFGSINQVAVLAHPLSKKARHFFAKNPTLEFYLSKGIPVLLFDFNGFGESDRIDMFFWKDVEAAVHKARDLFPSAKLVLHGTSFGAFHSVRAISALPPGSHVVLENVSRSLLDYWKRWFLTRNAVRMLQWLPLRAFRDMEIRPILRQLDTAAVSITMIACENDKFTPAIEMQDLATMSGPATAFHVIPGAGHLEAGQRALSQYQVILDGATQLREVGL